MHVGSPKRKALELLFNAKYCVKVWKDISAPQNTHTHININLLNPF